MSRKANNLFLFIRICRFSLSVFSGMVKIRYKSLGEAHSLAKEKKYQRQAA